MRNPSSNTLIIAPQWIGDAVMTEPLLGRLHARGERLTVGALAWVAPVYRAMPQVAALVENNADATQVRYVWEPPVERAPRLSLAAQAQAGPRCAGDAAVRVEPDGRMFSARGPATSVGNLLTTEWATLWQHPAFHAYRDRLTAATRCDVCPGLALCAADCPRERAGWAQGASGNL